ncbi:hypothetical protein LLH23_02755 [bacterium]|nr:hypothetical protein [bacterium]
MRKPLFLILAVLLVVFAATHVRLHRPAAAPPGEVKLLCASGSGIYWVSQPENGQATLLRAGRVGREGQPVATAVDIRSVAAAGRDIVYLTEDKQPNSGQLWRAGRGGGAPQSLVQGLKSPQGLLVTGDRLYWAETRPSPTPGIACVPVMQPLSLICAADRNGQGRTLLAVSESADTHFPGRLLGERDGRVYWLQHFGQQYGRPTMTVSRAPVGGGVAEEVVRAEGLQEAVLARNMLYWTAPSEEMNPPMGGRVVRCVPPAGGEPRTLTDWMRTDGRLILLRGRPLYCDTDTVWRIPSRLGEARPIAKVKVVPDCLADYGGALYSRMGEGKDSRLVRAPLTLAARLRGLFGP